MKLPKQAWAVLAITSLALAIVWLIYVMFLFWGANTATYGDRYITELMMGVYSLPALVGFFGFYIILREKL